MKKINIHIFNRGDFEALEPTFLKDKAIIRIHDVTDKEWYNSKYPCGIELFFNDLRKSNLSFFEKLKANYLKNINATYFTKLQAEQLNNFINKNKNKDFIIHCQYGRSRSVGVAVFMVKNYNAIITNKTKEELKKANDWVIEMLEKVK